MKEGYSLVQPVGRTPATAAAATDGLATRELFWGILCVHGGCALESASLESQQPEEVIPTPSGKSASQLCRASLLFVWRTEHVNCSINISRGVDFSWTGRREKLPEDRRKQHRLELF